MQVALNINSKDIRLIAMEGNRVQRWGVASLAVGQVRDGRILQPQAVGTVIESLFKSVRVPRDRVRLTVSGLSFTYRVIDLPKMKPSQMEEAVLRAARKEIALPLEELYLLWQVISSDENEVRVFTLGVPNTLIDDIVRAMGFAGVKLAGIYLQPLALARVAHKPNAVIVEFEPDCFDIIIVANGMPAILHTVVPKSEGATIEDNVRRLVDELSRTVNFYNITHASNALPPTTPLFLTGSLSSDENTARLLQQSIEYHVEPLVPQIEFAPDFPFAQFSSNIGVVLKYPSRKVMPGIEGTPFYDININLLSAKRRAEALKSKARAKSRLVPIALVLTLLLLLPAFLVRNQTIAETARLQTQLDRIDRELRLTRLRGDEAIAAEAVIEQLLAEVERLDQERRQVLGAGADTATSLQMALDLLAKHGDIVALEANSEEITIQGSADARADVINYALALDNLKQFAETRIASIDEEVSQGGGKASGGARVSFTIVLTR